MTRTKIDRAFAGVVALLAAVLICSALFLLSGCADDKSASDVSDGQSSATEEALESIEGLRVASMKGPTSVGLAYMMQETQGDFTVVAGADEVAALLTKGEVDIACVPANLAATLYQKTDGKVRVLDVNTLGVLSVVSADASITSVSDLRGKTVYMTGKGTVPEYTVAAVLKSAGLSMDEVDLQFRSEASEVAALLAQDHAAVGILPQPYATALTLKDESIKIAVDLTEAWQKATGGTLVTGVTVAMSSYVDENQAMVDAFLADARISARVAQEDPNAIAQTVVDLGIIDDLKLAEAAIPYCSVVCLEGAEMRDALSGYLEMLYGQNPKAIGGALPGDDFYYEGARP